MFQKFVKTALSFAFEHVGLDDKPSDTYRQQQIRRTVLSWTLYFGDYGVVLDARASFRSWTGSKIPIKPNIRDDVYCAAIREGEEDDWNFALSEYLKTNIAAEKDTLLKALGCSKKKWILSKYLNMMLTNDSGVRKQDGVKLFKAVAQNPLGHQLAFDFLRIRWSDIIAQ